MYTQTRRSKRLREKEDLKAVPPSPHCMDTVRATTPIDDKEDQNTSEVRSMLSTTKSSSDNRLTWTQEEDDQLQQLVEEYLSDDQNDALTDWTFIAELMPSDRNARQCRDRWYSRLRPGLVKGRWTADEMSIISECYYSFGPRWTSISKLLPGRSDADVKNKWYAMERQKNRKRKQELPVELSIIAEEPIEIPSPTHKRTRDSSPCKKVAV